MGRRLWSCEVFKTPFTQVEKCLLFCALTYYFLNLTRPYLFSCIIVCFFSGSVLLFCSCVLTFPGRFALLGKQIQEQCTDMSSLVMLCVLLLCVSELLGACVQQVEVFIFTRGHSDRTNHLPAPQLFATILFIYDKKRENQVSLNCVFISNCQNYKQRTWMCSSIFGSLFNSFWH